jgi:hypothetical protein
VGIFDAFGGSTCSPDFWDIKVQIGAYPFGRCRMQQYAKNILLGEHSPKPQN